MKAQIYSRLQIRSQPEVVVHTNGEASLVASSLVVLRHQLRLRIMLLLIAIA